MLVAVTLIRAPRRSLKSQAWLQSEHHMEWLTILNLTLSTLVMLTDNIFARTALALAATTRHTRRV